MQLDPRSARESPEREEGEEGEESLDFLVSKHLIPPPLMLLPKPISHKPKSLTPMLPLPSFVGIIPSFQPLDQPLPTPLAEKDFLFTWIGQAFDNVIYRKYGEESYRRIDNTDEHWNIWACDLARLDGRREGKTEQPQQGEPEIRPFYTPTGPQDRTLVFQSRFECGNLSMVSKASEDQYLLLLQNDTNTNGYSQWFFFRVSNTRQGQRARFKILNQYKQNNLYRMGMKIIVYSKRESEEKNLSWHRAGENIRYYENGYSRSSINYHPYFTLEWEYQFLYDNDEVYFAYSYPYTFSNLEGLVFKVESDPQLRNLCHRSSLCRTSAGNRVDLLTITQQNPHQDFDKPYIFITARVHPGESVSSYVCNGILEFLLSNHENAKKLRQNFIFKVVPMLNPDGVIHGNYRSNLAGYDINRKWENPSKSYHPEIYHLRKLIRSVQEMGEVVLFCDLHGHSMKKNAFVYGCHDPVDPHSGKLFPLLMSRIFQGFSYKDCSFLDRREQQGTCRTVLARELRHCNVYALQSSFCGPEYQNIHFTVKHFQELGAKFCEALLLHFQDTLKQLHLQAAMKEKSYFPHQDSSFDTYPSSQSRALTQMDFLVYEDRVNSENSQLSEQEIQSSNLLEDRIVKKYLIMRQMNQMRPGTFSTKRSNIHIRKVQSKPHVQLHLGEYFNNNVKSTSPQKKKELYESPAKVDKPKIVLKVIQEKKEIQPKLFEPIDIVRMGMEKRRNLSNRKLIYQTEKMVKLPEKQSVKIVLSRNFEFKEKDRDDDETMFKNTFLKGLPKEEVRDRKMSDLIVRKSMPFAEERNTINLFNSVLSSLRRDRR